MSVMPEINPKSWPEVTSSVARRCLHHLAPLAYTNSDFVERLMTGTMEDRLPGAFHLWHRLNHSGLAKLIAGGAGSLMELSEDERARPGIIQLASSKVKVEDQLDVLVNKLEENLPAAESLPPLPNAGFRKARRIGLVVALVLFLLCWVLTQNTSFLALFLLPAFLLYGEYYPVLWSKTRSERNASLLYHYLLQEFSEPEDGE